MHGLTRSELVHPEGATMIVRPPAPPAAPPRPRGVRDEPDADPSRDVPVGWGDALGWLTYLAVVGALPLLWELPEAAPSTARPRRRRAERR